MSVEKNTKNTLTHEDGGWTTVINETVQNIPHTGALGVYCYLASKPSSWEINKVELAIHFKCGSQHIDTCFKILKQIGAIEIKMIRNSKGQSIGWETNLKRKIPVQHVHSVQNPENRHSGDLSRMPVSHNLGKPESGKSGTINKRLLTNKSYLKNKKAVTVFSCSQDVKSHINLVLANRKKSLPDSSLDEIVFYVGEFQDYDSVAKKINIALKLIEQGKWNIPHGYNGITSQSIRKEEEHNQEQKMHEAYQDADAYRVIKQLVVSDKTYISIKDRLAAYRESINSSIGNIEIPINTNKSSYIESRIG